MKWKVKYKNLRPESKIPENVLKFSKLSLEKQIKLNKIIQDKMIKSIWSVLDYNQE